MISYGKVKPSQNYRDIQQAADRVMYEYFQMIEDHLKEMVNAPSLLARLMPYHRLYKKSSYSDACYLFFIYHDEAYMIKTFSFNRFMIDRRLKKASEIYSQMGLDLLLPKPIMFLGGYGE